MIEIKSGNYKGLVGHLSWDEDGTEWIVFHYMGHTHDILSSSVEFVYL